ncbi:MAG: type IV-A pilus assembly ATPase PilB [Deltaproteobacteria bacterium]|nr:type IV-A pilus assembly ATPase PilB [Deltaproteobacteria bacterium]
MSVLSLKIGEMLLKVNLINQEQLKSALDEQKKTKDRIGTVLVKLGYITEEELLAFLGQQFNIPVVDLSQYEVNPDLLKLLPEDLMQKNLAFPINRVGSKLIVAVADPTNMGIMEAIGFKTGYTVELVLASETSLLDLVSSHLEQSSEIDEIIIDLDDEFELIQEEEEIDVQEIQKTVEDAPVVKLVNFILSDAVKKRASDIHIEPYEREFRVRYRIDGVLYEVLKPPFKLKNAIASRIKILSSLDIAERRLPQDGRIKLKLGKKREMDYRVSVMPTLYGEKIVLRLLDKSSLEVEMTNLGFEKQQLEEFKDAIYRPYGMVLVTGPTGSGKTTSLYSAIAELNKTTDNISTAEDPVEYSFAGINQVQMKEEIGLTFAASLRSFLRQDPDIIMVGEVRDYETAEIAIKAALTGHLVLSTLHTNDAPSTVSRLLNMGIEPFLVSSSLNLVLAQRLARRICDNCREEVKVNPKVLLDAGAKKEMINGFKLYKGKGCDQCSNIGYRGRVALYEVMPIRDEIKELILRGASSIELKKETMRFGMKTLRQSGLSKARDGITTLEEVLRVSARD